MRIKNLLNCSVIAFWVLVLMNNIAFTQVQNLNNQKFIAFEQFYKKLSAQQKKAYLAYLNESASIIETNIKNSSLSKSVNMQMIRNPLDDVNSEPKDVFLSLMNLRAVFDSLEHGPLAKSGKINLPQNPMGTVSNLQWIDKPAVIVEGEYYTVKIKFSYIPDTFWDGTGPYSYTAKLLEEDLLIDDLIDTKTGTITSTSTSTTNVTFSSKRLYDWKDLLSSNIELKAYVEVEDWLINPSQSIVESIPTKPLVDLTISTSPSNGGSVTKNPNKTKYIQGESVTLTAVPNSGYKFSSWIGDLTGTSNPVTIVMSADKNITALFTLTPIISGYVRTSSGVAISGVTMNGLTGNPTTNSSGYYNATVSYGWSGTVTPQKTGYTFIPSSQSYSNVTSNQTQNYTGTVIPYTISGYVRMSSVVAISGVTMSGLTGNPSTNSSGYYSATVSYGWSGTVTPQKTGYTFTPASQSYSNVTSNQTQNYTGVPPPIIEVLPTSLVFDPTDVGSTRTSNITVRNVGGGTLTGNAPSVSGTYFSLQGPNESFSLTAQQTKSYTIKYSPTASGNHTGNVSAPSNGGTGSVSLSGIGMETPKIEVLPTSLVFDPTDVGSTRTSNITVRNVGSGTLTGNAPTVSGTYFSLQGPNEGFSLSVQQTKSYTIQYSPTASGNHTGSVSVPSNGGTGSVSLSGSGTGVQTPVLEVTPSSISFGETQVGNSRTQNITVKNIGEGTLTGNAPSVSGTYFSLQGPNESFSLTAQQTKSYTIQYSPTASGNHTGSVSVPSNGGTGSVSLSGSVSVSGHFRVAYTNTGNNATLLIQTSTTITVNGNPFTLATNDEIAIYTPLSDTICSGVGKWTGSNLAITVWGDNDQTAAIKEGFSSGQAYTFHLWDASESKEYRFGTATVSSGSLTYSANAMSMVSAFNFTTFDTLAINLQSGWNMISSNVTPSNLSITEIFKDIVSNVVIVKNGSGQVYWPRYGVNQISNWNMLDGYQVYMSNSATLRIQGRRVNPSAPIQLEAVWSLIAYLPNVQLSPATALASLGDKVVIMKDGAGKVYWPRFSIDQIVTMQVGKGYQIYLSSAGTLTYPASTSKDGNTLIVENRKRGQLNPQHFSFIRRTDVNATILVKMNEKPVINGTALEVGDEIGVFTSEGICAGAGVWNGDDIVITVWGDNEETMNIDGFTDGQAYTFRLWDKSATIEKDISVIAESGNLTYSENGITVISSEKTTALPDNFVLRQNYPNPFNPTTRIEYQINAQSEVTLAIYNISGQLVRVLVKSSQNVGAYSVEWDGRNDSGIQVPSGIYLYRLQAGSVVETRKMVLMK